MVLAAIIALLAAADLIVKEWIERQKPESFPRPVAKTGERLWLYRNHNGGFPFGFMEKHGEMVRGVPLAVISCLSKSSDSHLAYGSKRRLCRREKC